MAARPTRPRRGKRGRSDGQPGPPPSDHASHTPTRSHLPQERKRRNPVRVTLPAPHAANVPPLERQLFRAWSPTPSYGRWRQCPHPSADLNSLPFLAPLERERSAEFGIPPLLPRPNTRAWMRVNEWVGVYVCTVFPRPFVLPYPTSEHARVPKLPVQVLANRLRRIPCFPTLPTFHSFQCARR